MRLPRKGLARRESGGMLTKENRPRRGVASGSRSECLEHSRSNGWSITQGLKEYGLHRPSNQPSVPRAAGDFALVKAQGFPAHPQRQSCPRVHTEQRDGGPPLSSGQSQLSFGTSVIAARIQLDRDCGEHERNHATPWIASCFSWMGYLWGNQSCSDFIPHNHGVR